MGRQAVTALGAALFELDDLVRQATAFRLHDAQRWRLAGRQ